MSDGLQCCIHREQHLFDC